MGIFSIIFGRKKESVNNSIDDNPWAGLSSYEDPEKAERDGRKPKLFCGRDEESHNVAQLIAGNIFVTLYGKSGTGKTSLLNAGVFPRLRQKRYLPLSIRLSMDAMDISFQQCIIHQLTQAINIRQRTIETINVLDLPQDEQQPDYLWSFFARTKFLDSDGRTLFPVVVFDQFEEVFRERRDEAEVLLRQIAYMMDESHALSSRIVDGQPYKYDFNFRFVASIREDDLYRLEDSIDNCYLPELKRCRYRLRSLSEQGARDVILIPGKGLFKTEEQKNITDKIINKSRNEDGSISTNIISLLCSRIFVVFKRSGANNITPSLVDTFLKGNPFEKFYNEATHGFSNREKSYIEDHLIDSSGRRNSIPENDFLLHAPKGHSLINGETRILQYTSMSSDGKNRRIELIHDSFCEPLVGQKAKREKRKRIKYWAGTIGALCIAIVIILVIYSQMLKIEESNWKELETNSRFLAEKASMLVDEGDSYTGCLLALEALPNNIKTPNRPYTPEAEAALRKASMWEDGILRGHTSWVYSAEYSPDGKYIVSASNDNTIRIWDSSTGKCLRILKGHKGSINCAKYSKDGEKIVSASSDSTIRIWNAKTGKLLKILHGNASSALFSPDGKMLVTSYTFYQNEFHSSITVWDVINGKVKYVLKGLKCEDITPVVFSPNGKYILSGSSDSTIKLWELENGKLIKTFVGHHGGIESVAFSPDGKKIISTSYDLTLRIWDVHTGKILQGLVSNDEALLQNARFSPNGNLFAFWHSDSIQIWDVKTNMQITSFCGHDDTISSFSFSPDSKKIVSSSWDGTIRIWPLEKDCKPYNLSYSEIYEMVFSQDGKKIAFGTEDGTIFIWDYINKKEILSLKAHTELIRSIHFSSDGRKIISASDDKTIKLWDVNSGKLLLLFEGHTEGVRDAVFSQDGEKIYSVSGDSTIRIWDSESGKCLKKIRRPEFSRDSFFSLDCSRLIILWFGFGIVVEDIQTGELIQTMELPDNLLPQASLSLDKTKIATWGMGDNIKIWDIENGNIIHEMKETHTYSGIVSFSPDSKTIVTSFFQSPIRVWDVGTGSLLLTLYDNKKTHMACFSQDGKNIIAVSDGTIRVWEFPPLQQLIDVTRERFKNRPLTPEERRKYYLE